jgi:hypothetical protein
MTLGLGADGRVVPVLLPEPIRCVPDSVALISGDRDKGLSLRGISLVPEHTQGRMRTHLKDGHHAA